MGMFPYFYTVTSQLVVTFAMAMLVISLVIVYGVYKHGLKWLKLFVLPGVPIALLPLVTVIEVFSFITRPVSLGVRLFANMLAGHIALKVFASFIVMLTAGGAWWGYGLAVLPLLLTIALTALEFLVAFLQAYVFAILTCIYLNDAIHPGH
jgi:F-type H+-transporting ATPase subunit a